MEMTTGSNVLFPRFCLYHYYCYYCALGCSSLDKIKLFVFFRKQDDGAERKAEIERNSADPSI